MKIFITICLVFLTINAGLVKDYLKKERDMTSCKKDAEDIKTKW